jgi:hypothetical protein
MLSEELRNPFFLANSDILIVLRIDLKKLATPKCQNYSGPTNNQFFSSQVTRKFETDAYNPQIGTGYGGSIL